MSDRYTELLTEELMAHIKKSNVRTSLFVATLLHPVDRVISSACQSCPDHRSLDHFQPSARSHHEEQPSVRDRRAVWNEPTVNVEIIAFFQSLTVA